MPSPTTPRHRTPLTYLPCGCVYATDDLVRWPLLAVVPPSELLGLCTAHLPLCN